MHRSESEALGVCAGCGADIDPGAAAEYAFSGDRQLCFDCCVARGGSWDAQREVWTRAPRISDLGDPDS